MADKTHLNLIAWESYGEEFSFKHFPRFPSTLFKQQKKFQMILIRPTDVLLKRRIQSSKHILRAKQNAKLH